jgi:putative ABC transport system permease protein
MLYLTLRDMRAHARRLAGTSLAVVLGVAFLTGTLVLGATLRANFDDLFAEANAGTDVVVRNATDLEADAPRGLIPATLVDEVAGVDGVAEAVPVVTGFGQLLGADGEAIGGNGPPQLAGSWITDESLNPYRLAEGRAPAGPGEVVVNRGAAESGDLAVGDTTTLLTPEPHQVTIVGLSTFGDADGLGGVTFTALGLEDAEQMIVKSADQVSSISVRADDGVSEQALADRIDRVLPGGVEAVTGATVTQENTDDIAADFLDLLTTFLTVFAGIALLVATFSIYNTFAIIVAQRTRQAALLRALGARRGQIVRSVVGEAGLVGIVASLAGLAGGIGIAALLKGLFDAAGFALPAGGIVITTGTIVTGLVVGTLVTLAAGIVPAVAASRVAPLAALRAVAVESRGPSVARVAAGAVLTAAGVATTLVAALSGTGGLALVGAGAVVTLVGAVVSGPAVARPIAGLLGAPVARLRGMTGELARENARRNPRRTAGTAAALMVGVAVVSLFTVFAALPEVSRAVGLGQGFVAIDGDTRQVTVTDPAEMGKVLDVGVTSGSLADVGDGSVAVSDGSADANGWDVGSTVPVTFADGQTADLRVAATYETADIVGNYLVPEPVWAPHGVQDADTMVIVESAPGVTPAETKAAVTTVADRFGGPDVQDRSEFAAASTAGVDMLLTVVYALLALAIVIALMGIANTLSLSVHERTRELGLLRAVGQTRRQVRQMVRWESVLVATFGAIGGIGLGVFLGWALVEAASATSGSAVGVFALPAGRLAVVLLVGAVAGVVAGLRPARRAARLDVLEAIATE